MRHRDNTSLFFIGSPVFQMISVYISQLDNSIDKILHAHSHSSTYSNRCLSFEVFDRPFHLKKMWMNEVYISSIFQIPETFDGFDSFDTMREYS
jgi:hypothetical protein